MDKLMNETRVHKKGGGVAIVFNDFLQCKQLSFGNFASFQYVALLLKFSSWIMFINIYSPPKYRANLFDDFTDLLSMICMNFYPRTKGPPQLWCAYSGLNHLSSSEYFKDCHDWCCFVWSCLRALSWYTPTISKQCITENNRERTVK